MEARRQGKSEGWTFVERAVKLAAFEQTRLSDSVLASNLRHPYISSLSGPGLTSGLPHHQVLRIPQQTRSALLHPGVIDRCSPYRCIVKSMWWSMQVRLLRGSLRSIKKVNSGRPASHSFAGTRPSGSLNWLGKIALTKESIRVQSQPNFFPVYPIACRAESIESWIHDQHCEPRSAKVGNIVSPQWRFRWRLERRICSISRAIVDDIFHRSE